jgi:hypothetical protein
LLFNNQVELNAPFTPKSNHCALLVESKDKRMKTTSNFFFMINV